MEEKSYASDYRVGDWELLRMFKKDFEKIPVLSRDEEQLVAKRARAGDRTAADLLVESNIRFVIHVVFKYWYPGLPLMDLISEGCKGLVKAAKKFNPERNVRFITYAYPAIANLVYDATGDHYQNNHASLDDPAYDDQDETTQKDLLAAKDPDIDETAANKQVHRALIVLNERERRIIMLRFWMDLSLDETATRIGLSRSYVSQIENGSLRKMRWALTSDFKMDQQQHPELVGVSV